MLRTSSGMQSLYVHDGAGNPVALLTSAGYTAFAYNYDPYGVPALTADSGGLGTSQNPYTFKAGIQDRTTGFIKYGQRWYNPTTGRWTQQDTLDTPLNPHNANRYAFAANDPINNSDPLGLYSFGEGVSDCAVGAATNAAIGLGLGLITGGGLSRFLGYWMFSKRWNRDFCRSCDRRSRGGGSSQRWPRLFGMAGRRDKSCASDLLDWSQSCFPKKGRSGLTASEGEPSR